MAIFSSLANQLLPLTAALSGVTLAIGVFACPMESLALQHAFLVLSALTVIGLSASFVWHVRRPGAYHRRVKYELGLIPLALFWGFLIFTYATLQRVREANALTQMRNDAKQIGLAMHSFHDANKRIPANICEADGTPLLSWRMSTCPYIDQGPLHNQFDLTKSWDSPANLPLVEKMPYEFHSIVFDETPGNTPWQGFVGPGTAFEPGRKLELVRDFPDGMSNTIFFIEAQQHVPWSKPADIPYGPDIPLPPLGQRYFRSGEAPFCCPVRGEPRYLVCMGDATVRMFTPDIPEQRLRSLIVRNDGEPSDGWLPD